MMVPVVNVIPFLLLLISHITSSKKENSMEMKHKCRSFRNGPSFDIKELVGVWMTVYTQPKNVNCFTLSIRATTELEREQLITKYGSFGGRVNWSQCFLEVASIHRRHYLCGDGAGAGLLENIVVFQDDDGRYILQEQAADQWSMFGRRGSELLVMRDCSGEEAAVFVRAPYWPAPQNLFAVLYRSGIAYPMQHRVFCEPLNMSSQPCK